MRRRRSQRPHLARSKDGRPAAQSRASRGARGTYIDFEDRTYGLRSFSMTQAVSTPLTHWSWLSFRLRQSLVVSKPSPASFRERDEADARANRRRYRKMKAILACMRRHASDLSDLLGPPWQHGDEPRMTHAPPDTVELIQVFEEACRHVVAAVDQAREVIPPSVHLADDPILAKAPREDRLPQAIVAALGKASYPVTGARLRDLTRVFGADRRIPSEAPADREEGRKQWDEAARRSPRHAPRVPGTARKRKSKRSFRKR